MERRQNPYNGMSLEDLAEAMQKRAGELQGRRERTPGERLALADDTALMVLTAAALLTPGHHAAGEPERGMDSPPGFAAVFGAWHALQAKTARYRVLVRAANAALGRRMEAWIRDGRVAGERAYDLAMASDEGLQLVLQELEKLRGAR